MMKIRIDTARRASEIRCLLYAVGLIALLTPHTVLAQVSGTAPLSPPLMFLERLGNTTTVIWPATIKWSDGSAFPTPPPVLTYTVYSAAPGQPWKVAATVTALTWTSPPLSTAGAVCYVATDTLLVGGLESTPSAVLCIGVGLAAQPPVISLK